MSEEERLATYLGILRDLGYELSPDAKIVDFGCGSGALVRCCREQGLNAFGCDLALTTDVHAIGLRIQDVLRRIPRHLYRLPFDEESVDLVISDQVLEHVDDLRLAFSEMERILKPGGVMLHIFTSPYRLIEPNIFVPLAAVIRRNWWLRLWAHAGIRNSFQRRLSVTETVRRNSRYLSDEIHHRTKRQLSAYAFPFFPRVFFYESLFLKHNRRTYVLFYLSRLLPLLPWLYSTFQSRVLFARKPAWSQQAIGVTDNTGGKTSTIRNL